MRLSLRNTSLALATVRRELSGWRTRSDADRTTGLEQTRRLAELARELADVQKQVNRQEAQLADVSHKVAQQDQKMLIIEQELSEIKETLGGKQVNSSGERSVEKLVLKTPENEVSEEDSNQEELDRLSRKRKHVENLSVCVKKQQKI